jgi:AraC-like DNA-binding protein
MPESETWLGRAPQVLRPLRTAVRALGEPEHFFVGLPDARLALPRNVLLFGKQTLVAGPTATAHHRYMLVVNLEGTVVLWLDGLRLTLAPGQALLVFPFQLHRYEPPASPRLTWLFATFELPGADALQPLRNLPVDIPAALGPWLGELLAEYRRSRRDQAPADEVAALLAYGLLRLARTCRRASPESRANRPPLPAHQLVQRACRLILSRLDKPLHAGRLAAELAVSAGHLRNCFHRVIGMRLTAYIRRARIYAACSLLSRTESNITDIAGRCGFGSVYAFSRAFRREVGQAPTQYRTHLWVRRNRGRPGRLA